jgi:hypothetical protein
MSGDAASASWSEDWIDQALEDSFPASDPPPWTGGIMRVGDAAGAGPPSERRSDGR